MSDWKIGDQAKVIADNQYGDGAADIGIVFEVEGLREGRGGLVLLTSKGTRGFDGFYANRCLKLD
jgi:hypothetical protein